MRGTPAVRGQQNVHLALTRFRPLSATMTGKGQIMWRGTALAGWACIAAAASACAGRAPLPAKVPIVISDQSGSECVPCARNISGIAIWGDAVTWWAQAASRHVRSGRPAPGSVLVLRG